MIDLRHLKILIQLKLSKSCILMKHSSQKPLVKLIQSRIAITLLATRSLAKFNTLLSYQRRPCPHLFGIGAGMNWSRRLRRQQRPVEWCNSGGAAPA